MTTARTLYDKIWDAHVVADRQGVGREPALYRPAPDPRGHDAPGVRRPAGQRPPRAPPGPHARRRRPQHADRRPVARHGRRQGSRGARTAGDARPQCEGARHPVLPDGRHQERHRPRRRPRTGPHAAGPHHRLRRQPHVDARRVRRPRPRHRHQRSRARAGDADAARAQDEEHGRPRRRRIPPRRRRQGPRAAPDRHHRHQWRRRPCHRIHGLGHPLDVDGRPHDAVQPLDRRRRARRARRAGRDDIRLHEGPSRRAERRTVGSRAPALEDAALRRRRALGRRSSTSPPKTSRPTITWGTSPEQAAPDHGHRARARRRSATR